MCLPALRAVRERWPRTRITLLARPWVADLYARESFLQSGIDSIMPYAANPGRGDWPAKYRIAQQVRALGCDAALLLTNSFESAAVVRLAGIPRRIGYARDGRGWLLTDAVERPVTGAIPPFQAFYYLELLRRIGWIDTLPPTGIVIRLNGNAEAAAAGAIRLATLGLQGPVIGVSPGAAYGTAKRYIPERFAEAAARIAKEIGGQVALFGSGSERELCNHVGALIAGQGVRVHNAAGQTALGEFIEMAAACRLFLTNDSGAMHIASALGIPTVTVFGPTDEFATGPTGELARVIREPVDCAPCHKRECPIDHRCMTRVPAEGVVKTALEVLR